MTNNLRIPLREPLSVSESTVVVTLSRQWMTTNREVQTICLSLFRSLSLSLTLTLYRRRTITTTTDADGTTDDDCAKYAEVQDAGGREVVRGSDTSV